MDTSGFSAYAQQMIAQLELEPHPEGGWYRRTWQSPIAAPTFGDAAAGSPRAEDAAAGSPGAVQEMGENNAQVRPLASLIYFLLPAGDASAWHKVDADELWLWHGPGELVLELAPDAAGAPDTAHATQFRLGNNAALQGQAQAIVSAGSWQRTLPGSEDVLVSCVVSPGFVYAGFELT